MAEGREEQSVIDSLYGFWAVAIGFNNKVLEGYSKRRNKCIAKQPEDHFLKGSVSSLWVTSLTDARQYCW